MDTFKLIIFDNVIEVKGFVTYLVVVFMFIVAMAYIRAKFGHHIERYKTKIKHKLTRKKR